MTDNAYEMKRLLNLLVGTHRSHPSLVLDPLPLEQAVAWFTAYQLYWVEGLGLLDKYTCTTVSITATLEDDSLLQGTATISGNAGAKGVSFQTGIFTYRPVDTKGNWVTDYAKAACGKLVLITHTGVMSTIDCDVISLPDARKRLKVKTYVPKNPRYERQPDEVRRSPDGKIVPVPRDVG